MSFIGKIRATFDAMSVDAILLTSPVNRFYASGFLSSDGMVLISRSGAYLMTDFRYIEAAEAACGKYFEIIMTSKTRKYNDICAELIKKDKIKKLGFEENRVAYSEYLSYSSALGAELCPVENTMTVLRAVKEENELALIKKAQEITDMSFIDILPEIKEGMTERELYAKLVYILYKNGATDMAFSPIVVSGANSSLPHGVATQKKIERGDFITMDFGAAFGGYCSDMTRTVALGFATDKMKKIYDIVLKAQEIGLREAKAGRKWLEVDAAARAYIAEQGYGDCFGHGLGHSLGIEIHEPIALPGEPAPVGSVTSVEPGIYLPGEFGVRIEDIVVLNNEGNEDLTTSDKSLIILN